MTASMTVSELIERLKEQPQDIKVAFVSHDNIVLLEVDDIAIVEACHPTPDGWVAVPRIGEKKETEKYLLFG